MLSRLKAAWKAFKQTTHAEPTLEFGTLDIDIDDYVVIKIHAKNLPQNYLDDMATSVKHIFPTTMCRGVLVIPEEISISKIHAEEIKLVL